MREAVARVRPGAGRSGEQVVLRIDLWQKSFYIETDERRISQQASTRAHVRKEVPAVPYVPRAIPERVAGRAGVSEVQVHQRVARGAGGINQSRVLRVIRGRYPRSYVPMAK